MYSVNWTTKVITIPVSDMQLVSGTEYILNMSDFHIEIRRLEWSYTDGFWADQILEHTLSKTLAGTVYAPLDEIINGYTIAFDPIATKVSLQGSDNNIIDVLVINGVSVIPSNSRGTVVVDSGGSGITETVLHEYLDSYFKLEEIKQYSKKASDNAEEVNLKIT